MAQVTYPLDDIEYLAENAQIYTCTRTSGVYTNGHFNANVTGDNTKVRVNDGLAWLKIAKYKGVAFLSDAMVELDLGLADANLPRIDGIFIQFTTAKNGTEIIFKKGTASSSPIPPAPVQTESVYELRLFSITRPVGSTVIRLQDIIDNRLDPTVCGLMRDGVTGIDTTVINNQFQEFLQTLVEAYRTAISGTLAGELEQKILALKQQRPVTLLSTGWVGDVEPFMQTLALAEILVTDSPSIDIELNDTYATAIEEEKQWDNILKVETLAGQLKFYFKKKPTINLNVNVKGV